MITNQFYFFVRLCIDAFAMRVGQSAYRMMRFVDYMQRCKDTATKKQNRMKLSK